jgi:hypothetical protein
MCVWGVRKGLAWFALDIGEYIACFAWVQNSQLHFQCFRYLPFPQLIRDVTVPIVNSLAPPWDPSF